MIKRIVDIAEPAYLHLKNKQLLIDKEKVTVGTIPIEDLGVLILQDSAIVITQRVLIACQQNNVAVIFCDEKHLPYSLIMPIAEGNKRHQRILAEQINISIPIKKRLWQQVVSEKITQQSDVLIRLGKSNARLKRLAGQVKSADSTNCEAQAAKIYWAVLFDFPFVRDADGDDVNVLLNYGYAVIRAAIARSICAAGLHPSIGIFHHNQYNALCLADDLMEPFRPWVDYATYQLIKNDLAAEQVSINQTHKQALLRVLSADVHYQDKTMPMMIALNYLMAALKRCYRGESKRLIFPQLL